MIYSALIFGLAIFLFAMHSLERGIRDASGDRLNKWLASGTSNPISSAGTGILVTAILQSSSMVSLVGLAFVSAGIIPLYNGIGIVLGANLGTTMTGWIVAVVGFKMDLHDMIVPLLGIGSGLLLISAKPRSQGLGRAVFAFGLLIFGLELMKESVAGTAELIDLSAYENLPTWGYLLIGLALAAVMQSSSAVMIITLSLLHVDLVAISDAAAIVIGADLGTTSTTILGSLGKSVVKKQLALAHVFFNFVVDAMAFFILLPVLPQMLNQFSISDPLFGLVAFHSFFNLAGLLLFLPFLGAYTRWIERLLVMPVDSTARFFQVPVEITSAALDSLSQARVYLCRKAIKVHIRELELIIPQHQQALIFENHESSAAEDEFDFKHRYESLKNLEADLLNYAARLRLAGISEEQDQAITREIESARACVYASKTLKDIRHDYGQLLHTFNSNFATELSTKHQKHLHTTFETLLPLLLAPHKSASTTDLTIALQESNDRHHEDVNGFIVRCLGASEKTIPRLSTWFNLNHELHHCARYLIRSAAVLAR